MACSVLLTGASGVVGFEALQELLRRKEKYAIRILALDQYPEKKIFSELNGAVEVIWGDLRNIQDVERAINGVDYVIHSAGIIPPLADDKPEFASAVNVEGTRNLIGALQSRQEFTKFVYTSSISVYGDRIRQPNIYVDDPINPSDGDAYARTKVAAEKIIQESGIPWSIFRLCGILGKSLKIQPLMFHMPLDTALEWCHPADAGYALVEALEHEAVLGKVYNLGGGEKCRISAKDFLKKMFNLWGLNINILPVHAFATQNFHSGFYMDSHVLNRILNFQKRTLQQYFDLVERKVTPLQRQFVRLIPKNLVRGWLLGMSEPLKAIRENNDKLIQRFYQSRAHYNELMARGNLE